MCPKIAWKIPFHFNGFSLVFTKLLYWKIRHLFTSRRTNTSGKLPISIMYEFLFDYTQVLYKFRYVKIRYDSCYSRKLIMKRYFLWVSYIQIDRYESTLNFFEWSRPYSYVKTWKYYCMAHKSTSRKWCP